MSILFIRGDARRIPLADESVQCVVTSPPYWGLRKYAGEQELAWGGLEDCEHEWLEETVTGQPVRFSDKSGLWRDGRPEESRMHSVTQAASKTGSQPTEFIRGTCIGCGAWRGAYGLEPTVEMYVQHTVEILREIRRVLRSDGVCFWNIGDSYAASSTGSNSQSSGLEGGKRTQIIGGNRPTKLVGLKPKDLCLIPARVALAAQADGWWVRSDIIWAKPNPMPESVSDRPTDAYEHVLMLTKSGKYYWDAEAVKESCSGAANHGKGNGGPKAYKRGSYEGWVDYCREDVTARNLRNVWTFATQPYKGAHFATFPEELPRRCILAATKPGDLVLDPFAGSGTVGRVAVELSRRAVLMDLAYHSGGYDELSRERTQNVQVNLLEFRP